MWRLIPLFLLCACSRQNAPQQWMKPGNKVKVLSTIAMIDDLVKEVGGPHVETLTLIRGEVDPHSYTLVKGDDEKFDRADLIFYNGLGLEHGASLAYRLKAQENAVALGERVSQERLIRIDGEVDPHVWMDVSLFAAFVQPIAEALSKIDAPNKENYMANAKALETKLLSVDQELSKRMALLDEKQRYLVTTHDAFNYFVRRYFGADYEERCHAPEGLAPDGQMSIQDIAEVVDHLVQKQIPVVFPESNVSAQSLRKIIAIAREKGQEVRLSNHPLLGDSMGEEACYIDMMLRNAWIIETELKQ